MSLTALIIEADSLELELMATVLARDGFAVERAADGAAGLELFKSLPLVDLVVCAYALPHKSGAEVCTAVKKIRPETRLVLLHPSGNDVDICAVILSRVGCDAVLPTPFRYDALKSLLGEWGMRPAKTGMTTMPLTSFAVPAPDISMVEMPAPPEPPALPELPVVEEKPEEARDVSADAPKVEAPTVADEAAESPIPIPVVFPEVPTPVLAEFTADPPPEVPQTMPSLAEYAGDAADAETRETEPREAETREADSNAAAITSAAIEPVTLAPAAATADDWAADLVGGLAPDGSSDQLGAASADTIEAPPPPPMMIDDAAHSSGSAEWKVGPPPPPALDDEPTLNAQQAEPEATVDGVSSPPEPAVDEVSATAELPPPPVSILDDEPTVIPGELPPPDVLAARGDETFDFGDTASPQTAEVADKNAPPTPSEWLAAPPGDSVTDGFAAVDFGSLDSALDAAFGDTPTARVDDQSSPFGATDESATPPIEARASEPELPPLEAQASEPELPPFEAQASEPEAKPAEAELSWALGAPPEPEETPSPLEARDADDFDAPPLPVEVPVVAYEPPPPPPLDVAPAAPTVDLPPPPPVELTRTARPSVSSSGERSWNASSTLEPAVDSTGTRVEIGSSKKTAVSTRGASEWAPIPSVVAEVPRPAAKIEARGLVQPSPVIAGSSPVFASAPPPAPAGARTWRPPPSAAPPASRNVVTLGAPIDRSASPEVNVASVSPTPPQTPPAKLAPTLATSASTAVSPQLPGSASTASPPPLPAPPSPPAAAALPPPPPPREAFSEPPPPPIGASTPPRAKAEPRTTLPPGLAPVGDLATTPLPRLLFELYGASFCGALKLHRKGADRTIDIWNGIPVAMQVVPQPVGDDLASLLAEHGRITAEQHEDAERRAPGREAQLLVALGIIDERDLLDVIREQTELRLAATFAWRDGTYAITASKEPPDSMVLSEVHPIKVIWRGVSEHYDVASLLQFFSTLRARYLVATPVFPVHYATLGPFLRRAGIAELLDGNTTFEQALRSDDSQALLIAQCLYVLIVTEMVRAQSTPGNPAVFPDVVVKTKQAQPVDYRDLSRACEEIARTYVAMKEQDFFAMLELQSSATDRDVVAAHERLVQPFLIENLLPGLPEDVVRRAREIEEMLNRAHDTLLSVEERRRYVARLTSPTGPSAGANI